jgi:CheY-like chemotaxis protein
MTRIFEFQDVVRVLVVDDYRPFADLLVGILTNHGYEARAAYDAHEALSAGDELRPNAVLLDVKLRHVDGFEFAAELEAHFQACRVLLMSASDCEIEPPKVSRPYKFVHKCELMVELFPFLEACRSPKEVEAVEGGSQGLAVGWG